MPNSTYSWNLDARENNGHLWLKWSTNCPARIRQGQIKVYSNSFPANPADDTKAWTWDDTHGKDWDTGLEWGTGWCCAYVADNEAGNQVYILKFST